LVEKDLMADALARAGEVQGWIEEAHKILGEGNEPVIAPGNQCFDPFECGFCKYCNADQPQPEFPLDLLPRVSAALREQLAVQGVDDLREVPDHLLSDRQLLVKQHTLANTVFFDAAGAASDLSGHSFPAYFLDFETIQLAVPMWKGTRPYQQIVFQFSLHRLSESGEISETGFLDLSGDDPSEPLATALVSACGTKGPVFAYNAGFEAARIRELAERLPHLAQSLKEINKRVVDLLPVARARYYHPSQQGSWSIKAVLPTVAPDLRYEDLPGVQDGGLAMDAFSEAVQPATSESRRQEIRNQLLAYCRLDTLGIVRLWQFFTGRREPT
jgi:hypothetical protein